MPDFLVLMDFMRRVDKSPMILNSFRESVNNAIEDHDKTVEISLPTIFDHAPLEPQPMHGNMSYSEPDCPPPLVRRRSQFIKIDEYNRVTSKMQDEINDKDVVNDGIKRELSNLRNDLLKAKLRVKQLEDGKAENRGVSPSRRAFPRMNESAPSPSFNEDMRTNSGSSDSSSDCQSSSQQRPRTDITQQKAEYALLNKSMDSNSEPTTPAPNLVARTITIESSEDIDQVAASNKKRRSENTVNISKESSKESSSPRRSSTNSGPTYTDINEQDSNNGTVVTAPQQHNQFNANYNSAQISESTRESRDSLNLSEDKMPGDLSRASSDKFDVHALNTSLSNRDTVIPVETSIDASGDEDVSMTGSTSPTSESLSSLDNVPTIRSRHLSNTAPPPTEGARRRPAGEGNSSHNSSGTMSVSASGSFDPPKEDELETQQSQVDKK